MKLRLWVRLRIFIFVDSALFVFFLSWKTHFSSPEIIFLKKESYLCLERKPIAYSSYKEYEVAKWPVCSLFQPFSSGGRLWIGMCWDQELILEYFCAHWIPPILFKTFWSRSDERPGLGSSVKDISSKRNWRNGYPIYQPLRSGRIWHKVNFKAEFNRFQFRVFLLLD